MKKLALIILALMIGVAMSAHETDRYLFRMLDTSSGLPDNNVRNMTMLPSGLMCIQTSSMLNLFDGGSCRSYRYDATRIPYTEYSGLSRSYYDKDEEMLWCTTRDHIWAFNLVTRNFEYDITERLRSCGMEEGTPETIFIDDDGRFWIFTEAGKIWICDKARNKVQTATIPAGMEFPIEVKQHGSRVWMLSLNGRVAEYDPQLGDFRTVRDIPGMKKESGFSRMEMDITSDGDLWIMFDKKLLLYESGSGRFHEISSIPSDSKDLYTTIALDGSDNLWIGSARSGVSVISAADRRITSLPHLELIDGKKIYHHTDISKIYVDSHGGVWIATQSEGLLYWHHDIIHLETIDNASLSGGDMNDESVKCMVEGKDGNIYIGTVHGLLSYDPKNMTVSVPHEILRDELCISLYRDSRNRIWVGTFYNGAFCIDGTDVRHYVYSENSVDMSYRQSSPNLNCVRSFLEDSQGRFWISVYGGVGRFDPQTGNITLLRDSHKELDRFMIVRDICELPDGNLLMSGDNGRFLYSPSDDKVLTDLNTQDNLIQTNQAMTDSRGLLWLATSDGLEIRNLKDGSIYRVDSRNGLPAGNIMGLALDNSGNVWVSSFSYVSRIRAISDGKDGYTFAVATYGKEDGVESGAFFQKSVLKDSQGRVYFGGAHGICRVIPEDMFQELNAFTPIITSVEVVGKTLESWEDELVLRHDESFITIEFSNLNYANPSHTTYLYMLENFDKEWRQIGSDRIGRAQYTYLQPGSYRFRVKAANNDTDWSDTAVLEITVRPPFHRSTCAYVIYVILFLVILGLFIHWQRLQTRKKIQENKEREERKQREDLDQMKFRFFTNISHELRTPLSLIILPLESIMKELKDSHLQSKLQTMHHNANQLLSLVNHLLDFRKLEMGGERLSLSRGNISEFVNSIVVSFKDAAQKSGISISLEDSMENPMMAFDNVQMQKIVNNLLSNALKFTPEGGFINVTLTSDGSGFMIMEVSDTGIGIPENDLPHIFDRFYRSDNTELRTGSGIGLSLVKQYAEMHGGSISVKSEVGKGTTFIVRIPTDLKAEGFVDAGSESAPELEIETAEGLVQTEKRHIMVVDDNADFREYLVGELSDIYDVTSAEDGRQCIEMLRTANPDVVVCDVMMPNMDGFEVVKTIRDNIETSHIPVILLSARTSDDVRLEGYETGADAYLTKPFKLDILLARIRNLIEERNRRIATIAAEGEISPSEVTITTIDQKLMIRIMECIENNMDNSEYSVEELSSDVGMHRMNLYRKLQSLAGMTPSEFIRTMRLKRAAQLLRSDPNLTVSEVSDMVGFNTQKYFTKYFKEMFGVPPSQFR